MSAFFFVDAEAFMPLGHVLAGGNGAPPGDYSETLQANVSIVSGD